MSEAVIKATNVGKRYIISHQRRESYTALRDVISRRANKLIRKEKKEIERTEDFWALSDVSFEVKKGEVLGIIGRNGAGKSTLLKILGRITTPSTGRIEIEGRIASLLEVGTGFHPELTGRENIFLNGAILGMNRTEIRKKFDEIVNFSGAEKFLDTPVKRFSSGMYMRLAFAVAAWLEPEILLVDEVLSVGDAEFQKKCLGKMEDVSKQEGRTVLFVSHNMGAISALCNRGIFLDNGKISFQGNIQDCIQAYLANLENPGHRLQYISDKNPNQPALIKEVKLEGNKAINGEIFDVNDLLNLSIKVVITSPVNGTTPYFDLKHNGEIIYRSFASDCNPDLLECIYPGEYIFSSRLHSPLKKGAYSIDIRILKIAVMIYDEIIDAVSFETDELRTDLLFKSWSHKRPGVIGLNSPWEVKELTK